MEEEERQSTALESLYPDLFDTVLRRIPLLPRTRLKLVCKTWCHHITALRHSAPPTTSSGLLVFYRQVKNDPNLHQSQLLRIENSATLSLSSSLSHSCPWLLDSCNGLVLYAKINESHHWDYYVSSPVLNQYRILPRRRNREILARESLSFDGSHMGNFKVVCFSFLDIDVLDQKKMECQIFSSKTGDWKFIKAPLINSSLLSQTGFQEDDICRKSVYRNGKLFWVWSLCMLVFDEEEELFNLVNLPTSKETGERERERKKRRYFLCMDLWVSEGKIHYCETTEEGFRVWKYCEDDDKWEAKRVIVLERLNLRKKIEIVNFGGEEIKVEISEDYVWPCAFNEDMQLLFFQVGRAMVYSYSFETGEFEEVWGCGKTGEEQIYLTCFVCPFLFNSVNLEERVFDLRLQGNEQF